MFAYEKFRTPWLSLGRLTALALIGIALTGCSDSSESADLKESVVLLSVGQRHMLASHEQVALTEKDIDRGGGNKSILADRLDGTAKIDAALAELSQMLEELEEGDVAGLQAVSQGMIALSEKFLASDRQGNPHSSQAYKKRIKRATEALEESASLSRDSGYDEDQVGPALMLGTLHLMVARDLRRPLNDFELQTQSQQMVLGRTLAALVEERAYGAGLAHHFPLENTVGSLTNRLEGSSDLTGEPESLVSQLKRANTKITENQTKIQATDTELETMRALARENLQSHLKLLEQANQTSGDEMYALQQQAYALRQGPKGGLAYDAQIEVLENQRIVLEQNLAYAQLQKGQLEEMIEQVGITVKDLQSSPIQPKIAKLAKQSQTRTNELAKKLETQLEQFKMIEVAYRMARLEVVTAYRQAHQEFSRAEQLSSDRQGREYAKRMAEIVQSELSGAVTQKDESDEEEFKTEKQASIGFWESDAKYYEDLASTMQTLVDLDVAGGQADQLLQEYLGNAAQARQSMTEMGEQL